MSSIRFINAPFIIKTQILQNTVLIMNWPIAYFGMIYPNFKQEDGKVPNKIGKYHHPHVFNNSYLGNCFICNIKFLCFLKKDMPVQFSTWQLGLLFVQIRCHTEFHRTRLENKTRFPMVKNHRGWIFGRISYPRCFENINENTFRKWMGHSNGRKTKGKK